MSKTAEARQSDERESMRDLHFPSPAPSFSHASAVSLDDGTAGSTSFRGLPASSDFPATSTDGRDILRHVFQSPSVGNRGVVSGIQLLATLPTNPASRQNAQRSVAQSTSIQDMDMLADNRSLLHDLVLPEMPPAPQQQIAGQLDSIFASREVGNVADSGPPPTMQSHTELGQVMKSDPQSAMQSGQALRPLSRCYPAYAQTMRLPDSRLGLRHNINWARQGHGTPADVPLQHNPSYQPPLDQPMDRAIQDFVFRLDQARKSREELFARITKALDELDRIQEERARIEEMRAMFTF